MPRGIKALSPLDMANLQELSRLDDEYRSAKKNLRAVLEAKLGEQLFLLNLKRAEKARDLVRAGIPKSRIGKAIGTTNMSTVYDLLSLGQEDEEITQALKDATVAMTHAFDAIARVVDFESGIIEVNVRDRFTVDERGKIYLDAGQSGRFQRKQGPMRDYYWEPLDARAQASAMARDIGGHEAQTGHSALAARMNSWYLQKESEAERTHIKEES